MTKEKIKKINELVEKEKKVIKEMTSLFDSLKSVKDDSEKEMIKTQINKLKKSTKEIGEEIIDHLETLNTVTPLKHLKKDHSKEIIKKEVSTEIKKIPEIDKNILKKLKKKSEKKQKVKEKKPSSFVKTANKFFAKEVNKFLEKRKVIELERDLIRSNLNYTLRTYLSMIAFSTTIALAISFIVFLFFMILNLDLATYTISLSQDSIGLRFLKVFWILILFPVGTFVFMYFYPYMERKSLEGKINRELPFATINMAAIAGSMIEPKKVFSIIAETKEYPSIEKELTKLLNQMNIYGYDLVTALKYSALNSPSQKLSELFNGLATTITSGGYLFEFFNKRAETLLFEYKLDKEKRTKTAETFMDIYISVVIAAPMVLMLLLMMMKISGLGVSLSTSLITFLVGGGVSLLNVIFLVFLQLKQPEAI